MFRSREKRPRLRLFEIFRLQRHRIRRMPRGSEGCRPLVGRLVRDSRRLLAVVPCTFVCGARVGLGRVRYCLNRGLRVALVGEVDALHWTLALVCRLT